MEKLEFFNRYALHNAEHYQFMYETRVAIAKYTAQVLDITDVLPLFLAALEKENIALKIEQGSPKSEIASNLDTLRDRTWKCGDFRINSCLFSPLADEVESAKVIRRIFDVYGDIRRHPVNKESGEMANLLEDLLKPENAVHLQKVNLHLVIPEMKKENDEYIQVVNERNEEISGRESGNVKAVRQEVDPLYDSIVETINATITLKLAKPEVVNFVAEHNQRIKVYEAKVHARETINQKEKKE